MAKFIEPKHAFEKISVDWKEWAASAHASRFVVGISGGVDSTCVAALACKIFGKENVVGVSLPCDGQADMSDVDKVFDLLKIQRYTIDIGDMVHDLHQKLENNIISLTDQCKTNIPPRIRMTALFAVAQCFGAVVINTSNRSESVCGYDTFFGDSCGCYSPLKNLVKTEIQNLAKFLDVPYELAFKTPVDGLQAFTDEQQFGFTYRELDEYIRGDTGIDANIQSKILERYLKNKFKLDIIDLPGPEFDAVDVFKH